MGHLVDSIEEKRLYRVFVHHENEDNELIRPMRITVDSGKLVIETKNGDDYEIIHRIQIPNL